MVQGRGGWATCDGEHRFRIWSVIRRPRLHGRIHGVFLRLWMGLLRSKYTHVALSVTRGRSRRMLLLLLPLLLLLIRVRVVGGVLLALLKVRLMRLWSIMIGLGL